MGTVLSSERGCWIKQAASAYLFVYGLLYFSAAIQGMKISGFPPLTSEAFLVICGMLTFAGLYFNHRKLRVALVAFWAFGTIANWMKHLQWVPAYSDTQYTVMAVMNMVQAISLAVLAEVWKLE